MLEIVSLFLGLVTGPQVVELAVGAPVAVVEVRLDGETVARLTAPPWRLEIDLGEELAPHELVAVARDATGLELDRERRWINIDLPRVEIGGREPRGGLTPLPVVFERGAPAAAEEMSGWFHAGARPLAVRGVRQGSAEVMVVLPPAAERALAKIARFFLAARLESLGVTAHPPPPDSPIWSPELLRMPEEEFRHALLEALDIPSNVPQSVQVGRLWRTFHRATGLGDETSVRFLSPVAAPVSRSRGERYLFATSGPVADVGLLWLAEKVRPLGFAHRIADAVAVAGREAHASGGRRAVVLVLSGGSPDEGLYDAAAARTYLRHLRVPLFVWTLATEEPPSAWGETRFLGLDRARRGGKIRRVEVEEAHDRMDAAAAELRRELEGQQIVMVAGRHLPHRIELAPAAGAARPAGLEPLAARRAGGAR